MKKRYIIGIVIVIAIVGCIVVWLNFNKAYTNNDPLRHITSDATAIIRVNGIDNYANNLLSTEYIADLQKVEFASILDSAITALDSLLVHSDMQEPSLHEREIVVAIHEATDTSAISTIFAFRLNNKHEGHNIKTAIADNESFNAIDTIVNGIEMQSFILPPNNHKYQMIYDGAIYISNNANLLYNIAKKGAQSIENDVCFATLSRTASATAPLALFVNINKLPIENIRQHGNWVELDFEFDKKNIIANGFLAASSATIATSIASQPSKMFTIDDYIPAIATTFMSYTSGKRGLSDDAFVDYLNAVDSADVYRTRQSSIFDATSVDIENQISQFFASDIALFSLNDNLSDTASTCLVVEADNGTICQALLNSIIGTLHNIETPEQVAELTPTPQVKVPVYHAFTDSDYLFVAEKLFPYVPHRYYLRYENTILISNTIDILRQSLYEMMLSRTFGNDADYRNFRSSFPDDNVFFYFCNGTSMKGHLKELLFDEMTQEQIRALTNFYGFGLQITSLNNMPYVTMALHHEPSRIDMPPTAWQNKLPNPLVGRPWAVVNHNTQEFEFVAQDSSNTIHLINSKGLKLWSHKVDGEIIGNVSQIDYYNNRKLQYLFCTQNYIYLIDRNGNNTADFPIRLPNSAVSGVTYIDYDDPKEFRLFVADSDRRITLYDRNCQRIQGWEMLPTEGEVHNDIRHFVSNNKDYLVMTDDYHCYVTDRRGNERVSVPALAPNTQSYVGMAYANTDKAAFVMLTADSKLAFIDIATGKIRKVSLPDIGSMPCRMIHLKKSKQFAIISAKRIVVVNEDGLTISSNQINLSSVDWIDSTQNNNIAVWDRDDHLGYIFTADGKIVDGFPIPAWSPFAIASDVNVCNVVAVGKDGELNCFLK